VPLTRLTTERLILRPPTLTDADAVFLGYAQDPEVARYVHWEVHRSIDDTRAFLERFAAEGEREDNYPWMILRRSDERLIGGMHLRISPPRGEFGFNLERAVWGSGYATEAARAVVDFAWTLPGIRRVQAMCHVDNTASARVLEKAGLFCEARLERYALFPAFGNEPQDLFLYAVTR
jgi:RimJ/RimL family protein N-acetyltransferase